GRRADPARPSDHGRGSPPPARPSRRETVPGGYAIDRRHRGGTPASSHRRRHIHTPRPAYRRRPSHRPFRRPPARSAHSSGKCSSCSSPSAACVQAQRAVSSSSTFHHKTGTSVLVAIMPHAAGSRPGDQGRDRLVRWQLGVCSSAASKVETVVHLLGAEALHLEFPTRVVFDSVTLGVSEGMRIGIVGRNGDGKSSLLGMLAGSLEPDGGRVTHRGGLRLGLLSQDDDLVLDWTVGGAIVGDAADYEWAADPRIRDVIGGLVSDLDWQTHIGTLSGGQRRRVALARLLVSDLDVIALDEPTNHLDVEGIAWLARHLNSRWPRNSGALLVITHDRWFLDEVCTTMWEVHDQRVDSFEGGYAAYVLQRVERVRQAAA